MKKLAFFAAVCLVIAACSKTAKTPISYTVETPQSTTVNDVYIPDTGSFDMSLLVKFLGGYSEDTVTMVLSGLPSDIKLAHDTVRGIPTFTGVFTFLTSHAKHATYPVTLTALAPLAKPQTYNFNLTVIPPDCAAVLVGAYTGHNACTSRGYTYAATATTDGTNSLVINNLGGYASNTYAHVIVNCEHDSLYINSQDIGNGVMMQGYGVFNSDSMTIYYTATNTPPSGAAETCTAILKR